MVRAFEAASQYRLIQNSGQNLNRKLTRERLTNCRSWPTQRFVKDIGGESKGLLWRSLQSFSL